MDRTTWLQHRRMQKFRDVLSRWERKVLSRRLGRILGMSDRQFRRYRVRYEEEGLAGLADRHLGKASAKRVPVDQVDWIPTTGSTPNEPRRPTEGQGAPADSPRGGAPGQFTGAKRNDLQ
jgi:Winged helix-turn helix